jgi:ParB family chromosome partitioning protein
LKVKSIPLSDIFCDEDFNSRNKIAPHTILELAESIREIGLQSPIKVRPDPKGRAKYVIIYGHRRFVACQSLGLATIDAVVASSDDLRASLENISENLQRQDLSMREEAEAVYTLVKETLWSWDDVAKKLNKSIGWVHLRRIYMELPEVARDFFDAGYLVQEDLREIHTMMHGSRSEKYGYDDVIEMLTKIKESRQNKKTLTVKDLREVVEAKEKKISENRRRSGAEIQALQELLFYSNGAKHNMVTRTLSWVMGGKSSQDLVRDFRAEGIDISQILES